MYLGRQTKFKEDLEMLVRQKLKELGDFPVNITPALKDRVKTLQEDFLELRQSKRFTEDRGITILREIDDINKGISALPRKGQDEDDIEYRNRKISKSKHKRKIIKHKK